MGLLNDRLLAVTDYAALWEKSPKPADFRGGPVNWRDYSEEVINLDFFYFASSCPGGVISFHTL